MEISAGYIYPEKGNQVVRFSTQMKHRNLILNFATHVIKVTLPKLRKMPALTPQKKQILTLKMKKATVETGMCHFEISIYDFFFYLTCLTLPKTIFQS